MLLLDHAVECDVCHEPTTRVYANKGLLGRDDMFCWFCFLAWYECGLRDEAAIRRESLSQRYAERS